MTRQMSATELKAKILSVLDDVSAGEEVEITRHGRTVARLVPAAGAASVRGRFIGVARTVADEEDLFTTGVDWHWM